MSTLSGEQAVASQQASFETLSDLWAKAFGCMEKLTDLNLRAVRSTLSENQAILNLSLSMKDPRALFALQTTRTQAAMEEAQSYWRHVNNIMFNTQADLAASAEARFRQRQLEVQAFVDTVANNAPAGSEAAVNALQSAVTVASEATSATIEASKRAAEQAL
jgi:phasin family protein